MEATKTNFHIEIGYAGVELDSVGELSELLAIKEEAFLTIGFAKDIGYAFGDNLSEYTQHRALIIFGIGLWMLEISINMIDARCRDFRHDLATGDQPKIRLAY
ncbi:hypothetical protein AHAS_Ahas14G0194300 [Arachis hypogaea]